MGYAVETRDLTRVFAGKKHLLRRRKRRPEDGEEPEGSVTALDGVTMQIKEGELFGLLGPNGAGKTTLIKILCTLLLPTAGSARVMGYDVIRDTTEVRRRIGYGFGGGISRRYSSDGSLPVRQSQATCCGWRS